MRAWLKWLGAVLVVSGVAAFPAAIWFRGPWGVMSLLLVMCGCIVLLASRSGMQGDFSGEAGPGRDEQGAQDEQPKP